jgi:large exoprotein involved in heme utilization and adhesion
MADTIVDQDIINFLNSNGNLIIESNLASSSGNGDITVDNAVNIRWNSANRLTLSAARDITVEGGARIEARGDGNLTLGAGRDITNGARVEAQGAGDISLNAGRDLILNNGARIETRGVGAGTLAAGRNLSVGTANIEARGIGALDFQVGRTFSLNGARVQTTSGALSVIANALNLENGTILKTQTTGSTDAGRLQIQTTDGITVQQSEIASEAPSGTTGNSGDISLTSAFVSLEDDAELRTRSLGAGGAGSISINATDSIHVLDESLIRADIANGGNAGDIRLTSSTLRIQGRRVAANDLRVSSIASVVESTATGNAGNIVIDAIRFYHLD